MRISRLQQQDPRSVGQGIGRYVKVDTPMAEIRREDRHNAIECEIIGPASSVPNFRLPEERLNFLPLLKKLGRV